MFEDALIFALLGVLGAAPQLLIAKFGRPNLAHVIAWGWLGLSIVTALQFRIHPPIHLVGFWAGWAAALLALALFAPIEFGKAELE